MVRRFFDKEVIVARLKTVLGNRKSMTTTATIDCALQELDGRARTELGLVHQRAWVAYFDIEAPVREGDKITDGNGIEYKVSEITKKDYGINQHLETVLLEYQNNG